MHRLGAALRHWHRRLGLVAAAFLVWLAVTGVAINESALLGLDTARVDWPWLMQVYGLQAQPVERGYAAGEHWLAAIGEDSALDGRVLRPALRLPLGLALGGDAAQPLLFAAGANEIALLAAEGMRVETLDATTLPSSPIRRIGNAADGSVVIETNRLYATRDGATWTSRDRADSIRWSEAQPLPPAARAAAEHAARPSLPVLRVLGDLHSGRLFGPLGPRVIDLAALFASLLAGSGVWMVLRARRRHQHAHPPPH